MTTDAEKIDHFRKALERLASIECFGPTGVQADEISRRMEYASTALKGPKVSAFEAAYSRFQEPDGTGSSREDAKELYNAGINAAIDNLPAGIPGKWLTELRED